MKRVFARTVLALLSAGAIAGLVWVMLLEIHVDSRFLWGGHYLTMGEFMLQFLIIVAVLMGRLAP